jgi:glycerol-3-phosphate dehydrogenase
MESVGGLMREAARAHPELDPEVLGALLRNHGSEYERILAQGSGDAGALEAIPGTATLRNEVLHAVREEMARKLSDVVFHRTDLGTAGSPGRPALDAVADLMASELGWERAQREKEIEEVLATYPIAAGEVPTA